MANSIAPEEIFSLTKKRWEVIDKLGEGGQGVVYRVRTAAARSARQALLSSIQQAVAQMAVVPAAGEKLTEAILAYGKGDAPDSLGALKLFFIPAGGPGAEKALGRLRHETESLSAVQSHAILKLLDANPEARWMVTEYHPGGTLAADPHRYEGRTLEGLSAFRPLVEAVAMLHERGIVHRDIKPQNIFLSRDERLVLGDFGITYYEDERRERLTETFERVGTREWMAPWANTGMRIDEVKPSCDVFPLAKVLWAILSGRPQLPYWWHRRDEYNLEKIFPGSPGMVFINEILDRCLVDDDQNCLQSAKELLALVDERLTIIRHSGQPLIPDRPRPCRICGRGQYRTWPADGDRSKDRIFVAVEKTLVEPSMQITQAEFLYSPSMGQGFTVRLFACDACGHVEMFRFPNGPMPAWRRALADAIQD